MTRLAVVIDWPNGNVPWPCWSSIWNDLDIRLNRESFLLRAISPDCNLNNNMVIKTGLAVGAEEFVFISADQTLPPRFVERARARNVDVVGALTATRQEPDHNWLVFNFDETGKAVSYTPKRAFEKVDAIGLGCSYVKADVFRKLNPPWFMNLITPDGCELVCSNDFYFFNKCKHEGIDVHIDATMESDHHHTRVLNAKSLHRTAPFLIEITGGTLEIRQKLAQFDYVDLKEDACVPA